MRFDQDNFNNITEEMMEKLMNTTTSGDPKLNNVIYELQQNFLPRYLFNSIPKFFIDFRTHKKLFLQMLIKNVYESINNEPIPFKTDEFDFSIEIIDNNFEIITINWYTEQTMLAKRMYFVSDLVYSKAACFLTEITFGGKLMFCRIGKNLDGSLGRANYGPIDDDEDLEKDKIINLLLG